MTTSVKFSHLVEIDPDKRILVIHRVFADGRKASLTRVDLPVDASSDQRDISADAGENCCATPLTQEGF